VELVLKDIADMAVMLQVIVQDLKIKGQTALGRTTFLSGLTMHETQCIKVGARPAVTCGKMNHEI
jgi:hypothetical protein